MKINIQELQNKSEIEFDFTESIELNNSNLALADKMCTVDVKGTVTRKGSVYLLNGKLSATLSLVCDRCLKTFDYPIHAQFDREFSLEDGRQTDEEDVVNISNSILDLTDIIAETIYLELPMKNLCREDCKGICAMCGQDLNEKTCSCLNDSIDPRLESLKNIFTIKTNQ